MEINDYNIDTLPQYFAALVVGKRRSGKSVLCDFLIHRLKTKHNFTDMYLFSTTANVQDDIFQCFPKNNRYNFLNEGKLQEIYDNGIREHERWNQNKESAKPNTLVVIDDMISGIGSSKGSLWSSDIVNKLAVSGRHSFTSVFLLTQNMTSVSPVFRKNLDALFYYRSLNKKDRDVIADEYLTYNDDRECRKDGLQMMSDVTSDQYQAMAIDNVKAQYASCYSDYVSRLKAKILPPKAEPVSDITVKKIAKKTVSYD